MEMMIIPMLFPVSLGLRQLNSAIGQDKKSNGRLIRKEVWVVYGDPDMDEVETVNVENFNNILRERVGKLVKKTKCFSKKKPRLVCAIDLVSVYWNFMSELKRSLTPAIMENCTTRIWGWHDFYYSAITCPN
jgi:hypothetical protein